MKRLSTFTKLTRRHIPKSCHLRTRRRENLKSDFSIFSLFTLLSKQLLGGYYGGILKARLEAASTVDRFVVSRMSDPLHFKRWRGTLLTYNLYTVYSSTFSTA